MQLADAFSLNSPASWVLWFVVLTLAMYFARIPAHRVILTLTRAVYRALRMASRSVLHAAEKLVLRNKEVLLAAGREAAERIVEREFERVDAGVRRDLSECPTLNRRLSEQVTKMEEDHDQSKVVPPTPPGWVNAVKAVADIDSKGDPMVAKILESIQTSLIKAQEQARNDYRTATESRHQHLKNMIPAWRKAIQLLGQVDGKVTSLLQRTQIIDRHMDEYENIIKKSDRAERMLSSSSLVQFFISLFVLAIAVGGALINFNLIARPMAEMVGGGSYVGGFKIADIAALVIILVEISMGLFLMESLRITRLFPVIGAMSDSMRIKMLWITLTILTSLACVESGLAYMRELLLQDQLATSALLRGGEEIGYQVQFQWITTAAQMGLGFVLPFALTFVAIPLETFIHSLRTVLGVGTVGSLRGLAVLLRATGDTFRYVGKALVDIYDVVIFLPLWLESQVKSHSGGVRKPARGQP
jgi:hypothetical protein